MTDRPVEETGGQVFMKIFRGKNYRPYRMPIYKVIDGPEDMQQMDAFMEAYRRNEDYEEAIAPYKTGDLQTVFLFRDEDSGLILYTTFHEFIGINRIHINLGLDE